MPPVRSRWAEKRPKSAVNDIVATVCNPDCVGPASVRPALGTVEHCVRAEFERWFAEARAVVNVVSDETGSFVLAHQASTQSRTM